MGNGTFGGGNQNAWVKSENMGAFQLPTKYLVLRLWALTHFRDSVV